LLCLNFSAMIFPVIHIGALYLSLDKDRREKVVKVASLSTHLVGGPTWVFTSVGGSWSARQGR
jgi:hypothetical protein